MTHKPHDQRRPFSPRRLQPLPPEIYREEGRRFFLTSRALAGATPFTSPDRCRIVLEVLETQACALEFWVGAYCLMPDHLHFLCGPGAAGHSVWDLLRRVHGASTNALWKTGWEGRMWQPHGFDVLLESEEAVLEAGEYVLNNPVRAGLVEAAEEWPWAGQLAGPDAPPLSQAPVPNR